MLRFWRVVGILAGIGVCLLGIWVIERGYIGDDFFKIVLYWIIGGIVILVGLGILGYFVCLLFGWGNDPDDD